MNASRRVLLTLAMVLAFACNGRAAPAGLDKAAAIQVLEQAGYAPADWEQAEASLEQALSANAGDTDSAWKLVMFRMNFQKNYDLSRMRKTLFDAMSASRASSNAMSLWLGLNPRKSELSKMLEVLQGAGQDGERQAWSGLAEARILLALGEHERLRQKLDAMIQSEPGSTRSQAKLLLAISFFEQNKDKEGYASYQEVLSEMDETTEGQVRAAAMTIASESEKERYQNLALEEKEDFYRGFWKKRDTFPMTEENERLGDHYRRLAKALDDYTLDDNGEGYFTDRDRFDASSPKLDYHDPGVLWDAWHEQDSWITPQGLFFIRHGEPDREIRSTTSSPVETWIYFKATERLLFYNFVRRSSIGVKVPVLNLAMAAVDSAGLRDDPEEVAFNVTANRVSEIRDLYRLRTGFMEIHGRIASVQVTSELNALLVVEGQISGSMIAAGLKTDTQDAVPRDMRVPFTGFRANFKGEDDRVDTHFFYAVPVDKFKREQKLGALNFDAIQVLFNRRWEEEVRRVTVHHEHVAQGVVPKNDRLAVGRMEFNGLEPDTYQFAFQITERASGKFGDVKGSFATGFYYPGFVALSDLVPVDKIGTAGEAGTGYNRRGFYMTPVPTRAFSKKKPARMYFEIYHLAKDKSNIPDYEIRYQVLTLQKKPGVLERVLGIGMGVAQAFFPYQIFLGQVGLFGLDIASRNEKKGLKTEIGDNGDPTGDNVVSEVYEIDVSKMPAGYYALYVTVRDKVNGSVATGRQAFLVGK